MYAQSIVFILQNWRNGWTTGEIDDWFSRQRYETMEKTLSREAPQMDISAAKELTVPLANCLLL